MNAFEKMKGRNAAIAICTKNATTSRSMNQTVKWSSGDHDAQDSPIEILRGVNWKNEGE